MFVRLYRKGYIYRDNRLINWCPTCASTISDLEVRYEHAVDTLFEVRYRIKGTDDFLTVATVRPETILADTAVAVHPDDERYRHLVGRTAIVPLVDREVPIIADEYVKMDFGTGALKVTPGHDPNDFEIGRRHGLPELSAIGYDGRMTDARRRVRRPAAPRRPASAVRDALFAQGLLARRGALRARGGPLRPHRRPHRAADLAAVVHAAWTSSPRPANAAVRSGRVRFHPKTQENTYFGWMENIRPWCVSRQLWWGHQIPVWYCPDGHQTVDARRAGRLRDVRLGRARARPGRARHVVLVGAVAVRHHRLAGRRPAPASATTRATSLSTARDIINLWVARMLMMGIEFMGEIPFSDVRHPLDHPGRRRPAHVEVARHRRRPARARRHLRRRRHPLRPPEDELDPGRALLRRASIAEGAKFANKLWNAARFVAHPGRH